MNVCKKNHKYTLLNVFFVSSFKIPTDSMEPKIIPGDYVIVDKFTYGARLFDVFSALSGEKVKIRRVPGIGKIKRNDIVVFHFPYPKIWGKIEMDMFKYYVKRCIGIPGDSISIRNGFYFNSNINKELGNKNAQRMLSIRNKKLIPDGVFYTYPKDSILGWNIKDFGPLYIPKKHDTILLDRKNTILYSKIIEWELDATLKIKNDTLFRNNTPILKYIFKKDYYFMAGDKIENSQDSRYFGLLPKEFIVGKAWFIWKSKNQMTNEYQWERFFTFF